MTIRVTAEKRTEIINNITWIKSQIFLEENKKLTSSDVVDMAILHYIEKLKTGELK